MLQSRRLIAITCSNRCASGREDPPWITQRKFRRFYHGELSTAPAVSRTMHSRQCNQVGIGIFRTSACAPCSSVHLSWRSWRRTALFLRQSRDLNGPIASAPGIDLSVTVDEHSFHQIGSLAVLESMMRNPSGIFRCFNLSDLQVVCFTKRFPFTFTSEETKGCKLSRVE
jgi:hypothetical protein